MGKLKPLLLTAIVALVAVAIANRVGAIKNIVYGGGA